MKKLAMAALAAMFATAAWADNPPNGTMTLWGQEGTSTDGYTGIDGKALTTVYIDGSTDKNNWITQGGGGTYSAVYSWGGVNQGWVAADESGDSNIDVEADIEMYYQDTISGNKMYFHLGNIYSALSSPLDSHGGKSALTAYVTQTQNTNHPMYVGFTFPGLPEKQASDFDLPSGRLLGGMVATHDVGGRDVSASFDIKFLRAEVVGGVYGPFLAPDSFDVGAHGTIPPSLWWNPPTTGGSRTYSYQVELLPNVAQADANYNLDPIKAVAPVL